MTLDSLMAAHCPPHLGGGARSDRACTVTRGGGMCYLCRAISCATSAERSHVLPLPRDLEHAHKLVVAHHLVLVAIRHAEPACTARGSMQVRNQAQHRAQAQDQALQGCTAASGPGSGSGSATRPRSRPSAAAPAAEEALLFPTGCGASRRELPRGRVSEAHRKRRARP